jgi:glycosyltransferase involved in cell wall biosynthesis
MMATAAMAAMAENETIEDAPKKPASRRLKLLFYIPALVDGGAERVMAALASHFAAKGHVVMMAVDFDGGANAPELANNVRLVKLPASHGASLKKLARLLVMSRPDIAISAIASASFKLSLATLLARLNVKRQKGMPPLATRLVLTYHGFDEHKTGRLSQMGFLALPFISRQAARVVAVSDSLAQYLARRWRAQRKKLTRIYNPVAISELPAEDKMQPLAQREMIILAMGRLVPGKRFDLLIRALAAMGSNTARLVILGEGPERESLERLIGELDLRQRVEMPGYAENIGRYLTKARCFALVSQKESFSLVLVEALAYGLPIVATDCGGPREVLDGGRFGTLVPVDIEPSELAARLEEALAAPGEIRKRMARAKEFSLEKGAQNYMALFKEIMSEQGK